MEMAKVRAYVLNMAEAAGAYRSYQFPASRARKTSPNGLVNPPLDLGKLAEFYNESTWHRNAVRVKARDLVGHGWTLEPEYEEGRAPTGAESEKEALDAFFWNGGVEDFAEVEGLAGPVPLYSSMSEVLERVLIDLDTIGTGYLVVIRDDRAVGAPQWYAHVQGSKLRHHKDRVRFRWEDGRERHWFKRFGLEADVHIRDGRIHPLGSLPLTERAPELVHFATYTPTDDYYGLPNVTPAIGSMIMDLLARDFNVKFFANNAVPQYAIIMEGFEDEDVPDETQAVIREFFATSRGDPHRTLVLSTPSSPTGETSTTVRFERLAVEVREGHFRLLREDARNEILVAHAVPGYRLGLAITGQLGGSNIVEADEIYKAEEIDPRRELLEERINRLVVRQGFGIEDWSFRFGTLDTSDLTREVDAWVKLVSTAMATPNQGREALGLGRVEDRPELDEYYWGGRALGDFTDGEDFALFEERNAILRSMLNGRQEDNSC